MASDDDRAQERVGTVLNDKWTLERLLGIGGMAAVYEGVHRNGARAAVKVLHPSLADRSDVRERFVREGYAANRVHHSGAVKVLDDDIIAGGPDDGGAFLVMELLVGRSIEDRIDRGPPIEERELLAILRATLDVLEVAHKAGVVHRDLKPENLYLARDPENPDAPQRLKILDFGLARVAEGSGGRTVFGLAIGTPSYMPPEQAAGRVTEVDARSDLFALAASCFRVLSGRTVHPADDPLSICMLMAKEPAPELRSIAPQVSAGTAAVIDRALEFKREKRWANAAAMRDAVDKAIEALGGQTITIDSGMLEVEDEPPKESRIAARERARESPLPPPSVPPSKKEKKRKEKKKTKESGGWSWLTWLVVLVVAGVGGKLGYDYYVKSGMPFINDGSKPAPPTNDAVFVDAGVADASTATPPESATHTVPSAHPTTTHHHDAGAHPAGTHHKP